MTYAEKDVITSIDRLAPEAKIEEATAIPRGLGAAWTAFAVGVGYAAISLYWALGGSWLLATVSASLADSTRGGHSDLQVAVWGAVVLKLVAAGLPVSTFNQSRPSAWRTGVRAMVWAEAVILTLYGLVLTSVGLLVQAKVISPGAHADHRAQTWHTDLWDPWFLVWGVLVLAAVTQAHLTQRASGANERTRVRVQLPSRHRRRRERRRRRPRAGGTNQVPSTRARYGGCSGE